MTEPETYAEYLWRERTESGGEVDKTCDHRVVAWFTVSFIESLIEQGYFVFCPKCGVKL